MIENTLMNHKPNSSCEDDLGFHLIILLMGVSNLYGVNILMRIFDSPQSVIVGMNFYLVGALLYVAFLSCRLIYHRKINEK